MHSLSLRRHDSGLHSIASLRCPPALRRHRAFDNTAGKHCCHPLSVDSGFTPEQTPVSPRERDWSQQKYAFLSRMCKRRLPRETHRQGEEDTVQQFPEDTYTCMWTNEACREGGTHIHSHSTAAAEVRQPGGHVHHCTAEREYNSCIKALQNAHVTIT
ncbi:hypothetical protein Q5P01_025619 [Channa striata]|uniref:Uncharacterized protein n=1 Tax=Channa striata TaxID=64152 RepID=A0AA88IX52_CHASR|nr:hypothetical protein Q5P01_025619 [Channa striata]